MKKIIWVAAGWFLFALGSYPAMAAGDGAKGGAVTLPRLGVEGGFALGNLEGPAVNDVFGSRLGIEGGVYLNVPLMGTVLGVQPEILYAQKGGKFNGNLYQMDYLEIPALLDINLGMPVFNPDILLGPYFDDVLATEGVSDANHVDAGLMVGAQVNFSGFFVVGRYEFGLTDVSADQKIQTRTFIMMVGLSYI